MKPGWPSLHDIGAEELFEKVLTTSDANAQGRVIIPKVCQAHGSWKGHVWVKSSSSIHKHLAVEVCLLDPCPSQCYPLAQCILKCYRRSHNTEFGIQPNGSCQAGPCNQSFPKSGQGCWGDPLSGYLWQLVHIQVSPVAFSYLLAHLVNAICKTLFQSTIPEADRLGLRDWALLLGVGVCLGGKGNICRSTEFTYFEILKGQVRNQECDLYSSLGYCKVQNGRWSMLS